MMYTIAEANSTEALKEEVQRLCNDGFRPTGGVSVVQTERYSYDYNTYDQWTFYQAMVKEGL